MSNESVRTMSGVSEAAASRPEQAADADALYERAVAEFGPALSRLARAYELDGDRRDDLLQDIHVAIWRSFVTFKGECSLRTWVYRVAHNTAATHALRDKRRHRSQWVGIDQLYELSSDVDSERHVDEAAVLDRLHKLIKTLKPLDRDLILLYLEEIEAVEIAEIVGLSPSNVAQKIHRIKKVLQSTFHLGESHVEG